MHSGEQGTGEVHAARPIAGLALGALGIVYGDIGTSPLYALRELFSPHTGLALTERNLVGALSLVFWSMMFVVSFKYVTVILRADNRGEGGIMALLALATRSVAGRPRTQAVLLLLGVFGASLFYGDGVITPAISVLSAMEGLEVATPLLTPYVVPLTLVVLVGLFLAQRKGTGGIGAVFGPVMLVWFSTLALLGVASIVRNPLVLRALDPQHAADFVLHHGFKGFASLGAAVLVVTGGEALYADMGHFGARPIRLTWFWMVLPALVLNYFGQGALLLADPAALQHPFYKLFPTVLLYPAVALATVATVIASQATISGVFSMTRQAIQLGFLPRMAIQHTSAREIGQIYIPAVNWTLLVVVLAVVVGFGSSSRLAGAYGIAVTCTMLIDGVLAFFVMRYAWRKPLWMCLAASTAFVTVDGAYFGANLLKLLDGGWLPLAVGAVVFVGMLTWKEGRRLVREQQHAMSVDLDGFLKSLEVHPPHRVEGTAVFLVADPRGVPSAMLHNLLHNQVLHERVILLSVLVHDVPFVPVEERLGLETLDAGVSRLQVHYGFKDDVDVPAALAAMAAGDAEFDPMRISYFLGRENIVPTPGKGMAMWRERLFAAMARNSGNAAEFFRLPSNRVIELGARVEI